MTEDPQDKAPDTPKQLMDLLSHPKPQQVRIRGPRFQTFYANNIALAFSLYDISLVFGEMTGMQQDGKPVIEEVFRVAMTREIAKRLQQALATHLTAYEERFGEIREVDTTKPQLTLGVELPKPTE